MMPKVVGRVPFLHLGGLILPQWADSSDFHFHDLSQSIGDQGVASLTPSGFTEAGVLISS